MSTTELTTKVSDLHELKRMREDLEAEITALEDQLKQHMTEQGEAGRWHHHLVINSTGSDFDDIYAEKKERHMNAFVMNQINKLRKRFPNLSQSAEAKFRDHIEKSRRKSMQGFHRKLGKKTSPDVEFL